MGWAGKSNSFSRSADLSLLSQIPKGLQILVARIRDQVILISTSMEERERESASRNLFLGKKGFLYIST
jgi:hypothetical protein